MGKSMDYSFKLEEKEKTKKRKRKVSIKLLGIIAMVVLFIFLLVGYGYQHFFYLSKGNKNKDYIYTARQDVNHSQDDVYSKMPKINLKGEKFTAINKKIEENYLSVISQKEYDYEYEFNKSKNILSLMISYSYLEKNKLHPKRYFKTYNINLNNGHLYTNKELLDKYHITEKKLNSYLEYKFQSYYNDLIKYKYFTKEQCDYNCYLKNRGITSNYLVDISLYVNNSSLTLYKFFYTYSSFEEEGYFSNPTYRFMIKK